MSKLEWYFIGLINIAAHEYVQRHDSPAYWRWHHSKQKAAWIEHKDGPNRHPGGWYAWMQEFTI